MTDRHRYFAVDQLTGGIRDELPLEQVTITDRLKSPRTMQASIPFRHPLATPQNLDTETVMLVATRDDVIQFAGPLLNVDLSENAEDLSLQCEDIWNYVRRRRIASRQGMTHATGASSVDISFTGVDQFQIVGDLIDHIQSISGGNLEITVEYSALSGVTRTHNYVVGDRKMVGVAIEELANLDGGFDWSIEPTGTVENITHTLRLTHPYWARQTGYVLSWDGGTNMLGMSIHESSRERSSSFFAVGAGEGRSQRTAVAQDPNLIGVLPLLESSGSWTDVSVQETLQAHADRGLTLNRRKSKVPTFTLDPDAEPQWGSYVTGDTVRVVVDDGWAQINGLFRINSRSLTVDGDGVETSKVELAEIGRF